ncbi:NAD(P)-binding domain-containing protein, partial [Nocardia wallacei]|uniref:NAD(P)-binding domain-containing protein n=1 Tax=Nocardia wallacei TaxID=480035 RepID=UPI00313AFE04
MSTIAVLGRGRVGNALATALTHAGHEVSVADSSPGPPAPAPPPAPLVGKNTPPPPPPRRG